MRELTCMRWNCVKIQCSINLLHFSSPERDLIVTSAFVSGLNWYVSLYLTQSHFLKIYFNESLSLKLRGMGGGTKPKQNLVCPNGHLRFSHFVTAISKTGLWSSLFPSLLVHSSLNHCRILMGIYLQVKYFMRTVYLNLSAMLTVSWALSSLNLYENIGGKQRK